MKDHHARNCADDRFDQRGRVAFAFDDRAYEQDDVLFAVAIERSCQPGAGGFVDGRGLEGDEQFDATFQLRGGWELNGHVERDFVTFEDSTYAGYTVGTAAGPVYRPADDFSGFAWHTQVTTPTWRQLQAVVQYRRGRVAIFQEATTGTGWLLTGTVDVRPVPTVRMALTGTAFRLYRLDGREFARSTIPRLKIEYQPKRELFFRAIGEYRSERTAALAHPHAQAREMVVTAQHATAGPLPLVGRPIKFPGSPQSPSTAPPTLGQHTAQVLRDELGYSEAEIAALRRDGVIDRTTRRAPG